MTVEKATLAGGCFWCIEAVFKEVKGVKDVESGYSGGDVKDPSYEEVCTGSTGHAEVVQISFDSDTISYNKLLKIFFSVHDPTTLNRQGADIGTQYRSAIFFHSQEQKEIAQEVISKLQQKYEKQIVTEVTPFRNFYPAEEYHQNYFEKNPEQAYCRVIIAPKLEKFRKT